MTQMYFFLEVCYLSPCRRTLQPAQCTQFVLWKTSCIYFFQTKWLWSVYLEMVFGLLWDYFEDFALQCPSTALINRAEYSICTLWRAGSQSLSICLKDTVIQYNRLQTCVALIQSVNLLKDWAIRSDIVCVKTHRRTRLTGLSCEAL